MKRVITYGTYDLLHYGHINLLKRAKELGDYLIVGITTEEFEELSNTWLWVWTSENGVFGYKVISTINANSIFLPATGYIKGVKHNDLYSACYYWSNQVHKLTPFDAYALYVSNDGDTSWSRTDRYYGLPVRPVYVE